MCNCQSDLKSINNIEVYKKFMNKMTPETALYRLEDMLRRIEKINDKCEKNSERLNTMMLELKSLVVRIRPEAKNTGWYGEEIETNIVTNDKQLQLCTDNDTNTKPYQ